MSETGSVLAERRPAGRRLRRATAVLGVGVLLLVTSACQSTVIQSYGCFNGPATVQATTPNGVVHPGDTVVMTYHFHHESVAGLTEFTGGDKADVTLPAGLTEGPASSHPVTLTFPTDPTVTADGSVTVHVDPNTPPGTLIQWNTPNTYSFDIDHLSPVGPPTDPQTVTCHFASQRMMTLLVKAPS